jgi:hypothetical protein
MPDLLQLASLSQDGHNDSPIFGHWPRTQLNANENMPDTVSAATKPKLSFE